jgi:hypothetical protein
MATEKENLSNYLLTLSDKVRDNVVIEGATKPVYHISINTDIPDFTPVIGLRQNELEDRTVPRVCVGPDLLGCIIGYASFLYDFMNKTSSANEKENEFGYKGGYQIYGFTHEFALAPNDELVPVASYTGERWLVSYSEKSRKYVPIKTGKLFVTDVATVGVDGDYPDVVGTVYLHVSHTDGLWLDVYTHLPIGFYSFKLINWKCITTRDYKLEFQEIGSETYFSAKKLTANLLSHHTPTYLDWK